MDLASIEDQSTGLPSTPAQAHPPLHMQVDADEYSSQVLPVNSSTQRTSQGKGRGSKDTDRMDTHQPRTAGTKRQVAVQDADQDESAAGSGESTRPRTARTENLQQCCRSPGLDSRE